MSSGKCRIRTLGPVTEMLVDRDMADEKKVEEEKLAREWMETHGKWGWAG